jgi:UDP-N-acetylglucosamine/UDP-N-acetylgalactosamine 4-epimerase
MNPLLSRIPSSRRTWLVTGGAGFIGSHLVETLLGLGQRVRVLDSFVTGHRRNVEEASRGHEADLELVEGDIRDLDTCLRAVKGVDLILHQAALGSVPRSIEDPLASHASNVTGFLNVLWAAREAGVRRVVYASSSSVYGDHPGLPKVEDLVGRQLSPYAVTKYADELYAHAFGQAYGLELLGLRYFNVFGPRQDPNGPYAAVIPLWFRSLLEGKPVHVNGDGETSRDFCYVENVVQANLLAATTENPEAIGKVYNVAVGDRTTLLQLFDGIRAQVARYRPEAAAVRPEHREARAGDVRHSLADVSRARQLLGYEPAVTVTQGLARAAEWYRRAAATS